MLSHCSALSQLTNSNGGCEPPRTQDTLTRVCKWAELCGWILKLHQQSELVCSLSNGISSVEFSLRKNVIFSCSLSSECLLSHLSPRTRISRPIAATFLLNWLFAFASVFPDPPSSVCIFCSSCTNFQQYSIKVFHSVRRKSFDCN